MEPTSVTTVLALPPTRVTWYFVTPLLSVAGSQASSTETPSAAAVSFVGAVGASVSGTSAAQGSAAFAVTALFRTVLTPVPTV